MAKIIDTIREAWGWVGIEPAEVVSENDFGNLIIKDADQRFWRLCPEDLYCSLIADSEAELDALKSDAEFLEDWTMRALVKAAFDKLGPLEDGRKYYMVTPGPLGGAYDASNFQSLGLTELISLSGSIAEQIVDLPDGAQVKIEIV